MFWRRGGKFGTYGTWEGEQLKVSEWGKDVPETVIFSEAPLLPKVGSMFISDG